MEKFIIVNEKTGQYLALNRKNAALWGELDEAHRFDDKTKAENYMDNNLYNATHGAVCKSDCKIVSVNAMRSIPPITPEEATELASTLEERLKQMYETGQIIRSLFDYHLVQTQRADRALEDLMHKIEFSDANVVGGYRMYKAMQELRQRRRQHKNACTILGSIGASGLLDKLDKIERNLPKTETGLGKCQYEPRVSAELFQAGSNAELSAALDALLASVSAVDQDERIA